MKKLTHHEHDKEQERRIRAAGVPIASESKMSEMPELLIRQRFDAYESTVFDTTGGAGLILPLTITSNMPIFVLSGVDIRLDSWPDFWFRPLEENASGEWPHYQFYGQSGRKFDREDCLNRFLPRQKEFRRSQVVCGLLLGLSLEPMPGNIGQCEPLRGTIKIYDQFEHEHSAAISLRADRMTARVVKPNPKRRRLFDCPDPESSK
jgi:hypothetical protein